MSINYSSDMDWRKYAKHLEDIISAIDLSEDRRIIVDAFVNDARKQCLADGGDFIEEAAKLKTHPHYDISNFHAGMPVLVRADNNCRWDYSVFSRITGNEDWQFAVCNGVSVAQCIPFDGNEKLLGTTDMPDECYINW